MPTLDEAKNKVRELSETALRVVDDKGLNNVQKARMLDDIEPEIKKWNDEIQSLEGFETRRKSFMIATGGGMAGADPRELAEAYEGLDAAPLGPPPSVQLSAKDVRSMYDSVIDRKGFKIQVKDSSSANNPVATYPQRAPGIVAMLREPNRIANLFGWEPVASPVRDYFVQTGKATATVVAEGALKPISDVTTGMLEARAAKIAGGVRVTDEVLSDFSEFRSFVDNDVTNAVFDAENGELLNGTGVGPNYIVGVLQTSGILTLTYPGSPPTNWNALDSLDIAETNLRNGAAKAANKAWVMSPTTFSSIRRTKDTQGRYLLNPDPKSDQVQDIWGKHVVLTTQIADGIAVGGDWGDAMRGFIRDGLTVMSDRQGDDFQRNKITIIGEERVGAYCTRPAALIKVTGLPTS